MSQDWTVTQLSSDDQMMMVQLQEGDAKAIAAIERRYGDELKLFCQRMTGNPDTAEDVVQDVLTTCCQLQAESLPSNSIRGWLYQIARRRCIDLMRQQGRKIRTAGVTASRQQSSWEHAIDPLTTPAGKALKHDRAIKILEILDELDEDLRSVVVMRYLQGLTREEIAEAIGLGIPGTKARLGKAMQVMREKMQRLDDSMS